MTVIIYYWHEAPARRRSPGRVRLPRLRYGHVSLAIQDDGSTRAYWGWWPRSFTTVRDAVKSKKSFWEKVKRTAREWMCFEPGRRTLSYGLAEAAIVPGYMPGEFPRPDQIDTVLVTNDPMGTSAQSWKSTRWKESQATMAYKWVPKYPEEALREIERLINDAESNRESYHFLCNNCATTIAKILAAGGLPIRFVIWSPSLIKLVCMIGRFERIAT